MHFYMEVMAGPKLLTLVVPNAYGGGPGPLGEDSKLVEAHE